VLQVNNDNAQNRAQLQVCKIMYTYFCTLWKRKNKHFS